VVPDTYDSMNSRSFNAATTCRPARHIASRYGIVLAGGEGHTDAAPDQSLARRGPPQAVLCVCRYTVHARTHDCPGALGCPRQSDPYGDWAGPWQIPERFHDERISRARSRTAEESGHGAWGLSADSLCAREQPGGHAYSSSVRPFCASGGPVLRPDDPRIGDGRGASRSHHPRGRSSGPCGNRIWLDRFRRPLDW